MGLVPKPSQRFLREVSAKPPRGFARLREASAKLPRGLREVPRGLREASARPPRGSAKPPRGSARPLRHCGGLFVCVVLLFQAFCSACELFLVPVCVCLFVCLFVLCYCFRRFAMPVSCSWSLFVLCLCLCPVLGVLQFL